MGKLNIAAGDWILVCDGKKAIILENAGDRKFPNLRVKAVREHEDAPTRDLGTDAPARVFASVGSARSATETTDWHTQAERDFLRELVGELQSAAMERKFKGLVVVAPPRALGVIREACPPGLRASIRAEVGHDYTHLPVDEVERRLFR
jgi:protein required for attachment to host cells